MAVQLFTGTRLYLDSTADSCVTLSQLELYRGVTGSFFGIGILPVSDLLDFRYFGRYY